MKFALLCIVFILASFCVEAQTDIDRQIASTKAIDFSVFNNSTSYGTKDGLASFDIRDIKEDLNGYLWLATGKGVSRFDGSNFTNFNFATRDTSKIEIGFTRKIAFNQKRDTVWSISGSGIFFSSINNVDFKEVKRINDELKKELINDIFLDHDENIWLGHHSRGLLFIDKSDHTIVDFAFTNPNINAPPGINNIQTIAFDDQNSNIIWLGSTQGLIRFDKITNNYKVYQIDAPVNQDPNNIKLIKTKNNKVFIGSWVSGFTVFDKTKLKFESTHYLGGTHDIVQENDRSVWFSTTQGLTLIDTRTNKVVETRINNFESGILRGLSFIDSRGILWYKWSKGLLKYDPLNSQSHFVELEKKNPLQNPMLVREILKWKNFYFVLAHNTKGLYKVNQDDYSYELIRFPALERKNGFISFRDMIHMDNGNILILSSNKIVIFNPNNNEIYDSPIQIPFTEPSNQVLEKDNRNNYWIGTRRAGLYRINFKNQTIVNYKDEFNTYDNVNKKWIQNYKWIETLLVDSNNKMWINSRTLSVMDLEDYSIKTLPKVDSINFYQDIGEILEFPTGTIWFSGYKSGIGNIEYDNFEEGIIQQKIGFYSKIFAYSDSVFFTLNRELGQLNIETLEQRNYNFEMQNVQLDGPFHIGKNEDLIVGGNNGIFVFNLRKRITNEEVPRPIITELITDGKIIYRGEDLSRNNFELESSTKTMSMLISSLGFHYPEKTTYEYRIEKNWIILNKDKRINLSNLSPGNISIELRACNNQNICNTNKVIYSLKIQSPWYSSTLAYLIYLLILLATIYVIYKFQLSRKMAFLESDRLKELDRIKTNLYANITHEFRTPLTVIQGLSETVKNNILKNEKDKTEQSLFLIRKNSNNLLHLVNEMLDLSKIESGKMKLQTQQGDIIPFIKYLGESFHSLAQAKMIDLTVYSEIDALKMDYDESKMASIVSNILSNAIKFTPQNGKIIVHLNQLDEKDNSFFIIKIKDNGIGVSAENIKNVFSRFYQVDSSISKKHEGTGIGLTLTKELVELMNGSIELVSTIDKGSTFIIKLPISNKSKSYHDRLFDQENLLLNENAGSSIINQSVELNEKLPLVLIIEDNQDVSYYLQACLEGKYNIIHTINGKLGIEKAIEVIPDIIISDVMMPEKDGFEVCLELKSNELTDHIPIILLTAKTEVEDRIMGLSQGADAYLAKPFVKEELLVRLDQLVLLRRKLVDKYEQAKFGNSKIETKAKPESVFLQKAITIIQESMSESTFATAQLSSRLHLSESQVYRKIKATTDLSTAVFIRSIRLQKGKELIQQTDKTISEIAYEVGFNDPAYFSKSFKEEFGCSPSELR